MLARSLGEMTMKLSEVKQLVLDSGYMPDGRTDYSQVTQILQSEGIRLPNQQVWKIINSCKAEVTEVEDDL